MEEVLFEKVEDEFAPAEEKNNVQDIEVEEEEARQIAKKEVSQAGKNENCASYGDKYGLNAIVLVEYLLGIIN